MTKSYLSWLHIALRQHESRLSDDNWALCRQSPSLSQLPSQRIRTFDDPESDMHAGHWLAVSVSENELFSIWDGSK